MTRRANQTEDRVLTRKAALKIIRAIDRGVLSDNVNVTLFNKQVIVRGTNGVDRAWLVKNFPDGTLSDSGRIIKKRGTGR